MSILELEVSCLHRKHSFCVLASEFLMEQRKMEVAEQTAKVAAHRPRIGLGMCKSMLDALDEKAELLGVFRSSAISVALHAWFEGQIGQATPGRAFAGERVTVYVTLHSAILRRLDELAASLGVNRSAATAIALRAWIGL